MVTPVETLSMDTIASCAFGVDAKVYAADKSIFVEYASEMFRQDWTVMFKFMLMLIPVIGPFIIRTFKLSFTPQKETLFFYDIISKTLKKRKETEVRRNDLIDMMMDAIKGFRSLSFIYLFLQLFYVSFLTKKDLLMLEIK